MWGVVGLRWKTAMELSNDGFWVERLALRRRTLDTKVSWEKLGFVKGKGNSSCPPKIQLLG